ncbi:ferredoxin [Actinoplanes sp. NPDC023936]|uniref:ferredoxin n=1 Tax=Actinoplanes sp. NPDC023936 TaxID=3154910 RepID=UPI0033F8C620
MRVNVDYAKCSGVALCEAEAPDLFEVQDDGTMKQLVERLGEDRREAAEAAAASCPYQAIKIVEA